MASFTSASIRINTNKEDISLADVLGHRDKRNHFQAFLIFLGCLEM